MERHTFLTDAFYEQPMTLVNVFDKFLENDHLVEASDLWEDSIYLDICDNEESREILKEVIADFDMFRKYSEEYSGRNIEDLQLFVLNEIHKDFFPYDDLIVYDKHRDTFRLRGSED